MTQLINNTNSASPFDAIRHTRPDGSEYWSARGLQRLMGYMRWEDFYKITRRAMTSAANSGTTRGFSEITEKGTSGRPRVDVELSRYAAYLVAMNGDPNMPPVAAAQAYFAIRTREAEVTTPAQQLSGKELLAAAVLEAQSVMRSQELYIEQADKYIEELQPKADYVDMYVADDDLLTIRQVAKTLGLQEKAVRKALLDHNWIYQEQSSRWSEKEQRKVDQYRYSPTASKHRYFRTVQCHDAPRFKGQVDHTLKINPQGAKAIGLALKKWGLLSDPTAKDAA